MRRLAPALLLFCVACVDRQPSAREQRERFDRAALGPLLAAELPDGVAPLPAAERGRIGDELELQAIHLEPPIPPPGTVVRVTLYLRVLEEPDEERRLFVHVEDRAGRVGRVVADHALLGGRYPMWAMRRGELLRDEFDVAIPPYTAPGTEFDLWIGLFAGEVRATVTAKTPDRVGPGNRLRAGTFVSR